MFTLIYSRVWKRSSLVLGKRRKRLWYLLRVNPLIAMVWWLIWVIPLWKGFKMFMGEGGLVWIRTTKIDANAKLLKSKIIQWFRKF